MNITECSRQPSVARLLPLLSCALLFAITACGDQSGDSVVSNPPATTGTLQQAAILACQSLSGHRLAGVGYSQLGAQPQPAIFIFDSSGNVTFERTFPLSGDNASSGIGTALVVDPQDRIYIGGSQFLPQGSRAFVAALNDRGDLLWESAPIAAGRSGVNALAYDTSGLYVSGFAQTPGEGGEPNRQAILLMKLDLLTGSVMWQQFIEDHPDPLEISAGLSLDVAPSGHIAVTGVTYQTSSGPDWLASVWDTDGHLVWQDIRDGSGGRLATIEDMPDVAWNGRFDLQGNLYVAGRLRIEGQGADIAVVKYSPTGAILWEFTRHEAIHTRRGDSFDEAKHLLVGVDQVWVSGTVTRQGTLGVVSEGIVLSLSPHGTLLWEQDLADPSQSGEDIVNLVVDALHNVYYGGMASSRGIGKDLIVEKVDRQGRKVWSTTLELPGEDDSDHDTVHSVLLGGDGRVFATGSMQLPDGSLGHFAVQLDSDGRLQWSFPVGVVTASR